MTDPSSAASSKSSPLILVAAALLIDRENRVLLAERPPGKAMAGLWELPGGKVEAGETPEKALTRELHEELGILTELSHLMPLSFASHSYPDFHLLMPVYACRLWQGSPSSREGQRLAWIHPEAWPSYPMPPADDALLPLLRKFLA